MVYIDELKKMRYYLSKLFRNVLSIVDEMKLTLTKGSKESIVEDERFTFFYRFF